MPMTLTIPEILKTISQTASSPSDIARMLRENQSNALRQILYYAYIDKTKWYRTDLPPFTPDSSPEGLTMSSLFQESKRLYIFKDIYALDKGRKDVLLIQILESIHQDEANLIKELLAGTFNRAYSLGKKSVLEAFPNLESTVMSS
jgi:hypothetical protein